jgi:hypothetical protein
MKLPVKGFSVEIFKKTTVLKQTKKVHFKNSNQMMSQNIDLLKKKEKLNFQKNKFSLYNIQFKICPQRKISFNYNLNNIKIPDDTYWISIIENLLKFKSLKDVNFIGYYQIKFQDPQFRFFKFTIDNPTFPLDHLEYFFNKIEKDIFQKSYYF